MPRGSVRMRMGKLPPDLWRETWDPDKHNLRREPCKVTLSEQKLLICEAVGYRPKLTRAATLPPRKRSLATLPSSVSRKLSVHSFKPLNTQNDQTERPKDYKIKGGISPDNKKTGKFEFPEGLLPLKCACGHGTSLEAIQIVQNYLRRKKQGRIWEIIGVLPGYGDNEQTSQQANSIPASSSESLPRPTFSASSGPCKKHGWSQEWNPQARHFVLIERKYRCSCEMTYRPIHQLKVRPRQGYTLATQEEKDRAHERYLAGSSSSSYAPVAAGGAGAVCAAAPVSSAGACGG